MESSEKSYNIKKKSKYNKMLMNYSITYMLSIQYSTNDVSPQGFSMLTEMMNWMRNAKFFVDNMQHKWLKLQSMHTQSMASNACHDQEGYE